MDVVEGPVQAGAGAQAPHQQDCLQGLRRHQPAEGHQVPQVPQQEPQAQEDERPRARVGMASRFTLNPIRIKLCARAMSIKVSPLPKFNGDSPNLIRSCASSVSPRKCSGRGEGNNMSDESISTLCISS